MFELVLLTAALVRDHPAEFKAAWAKAQARADLSDHYRHGLIDYATLSKEQLKYMTPQEEAEFWDVIRAQLRRADERAAENDAKLEAVYRAVERWKAENRVGPLPPPDLK